MLIYIGADHRGFELKEYLKNALKSMGYSVSDVGNDHYDETDDYPDFAKAVAKKISIDYENSRGILICGSGAGVDIVANKFPNVRSALVMTADQAFDSRNDDDVNILSLGANYVDAEAAKKIVITWLQTPFAEDERFRRRIKKISQIELELSESTRKDIRGYEELEKQRTDEIKPPSWS
ncbi:RpiB/LacA/LacB family sugar-phosphate isomerase [Candidatus Jorgensenbacteria bacterium]|nr:RpiB/LacA/LacB family sugar-phosphate isomerase [Candidatus Jorgensenbacteria bacterium]